MARSDNENPSDWDVATRLVHGGSLRSSFGETAEAIFLTQGYIYDSAESADARFAGTEPGFIYSRYANPTVRMFEDRLALLEGAEACRAQATGMAAVHLALMGLVRAGDHIVAGQALFGSNRWLMNNWFPRFGVETTKVPASDLAAWRTAVRPAAPGSSSSKPRPTRSWRSPADIEGVAAVAGRSEPRSSSTTSLPRRFCRSPCC